jgi:hypothetical protein
VHAGAARLAEDIWDLLAAHLDEAEVRARV